MCHVGRCLCCLQESRKRSGRGCVHCGSHQPCDDLLDDDRDDLLCGCDDCGKLLCGCSSVLACCSMCKGFFCDDCRGIDDQGVCERCEPVVFDNDLACLICCESVEDKPALRCSQCPCKPIHQTCAMTGKDACPQCSASLIGVFQIREMCLHNRVRKYCKACGGSSICQHGRIEVYCKDCGGSEILPDAAITAANHPFFK